MIGKKLVSLLEFPRCHWSRRLLSLSLCLALIAGLQGCATAPDAGSSDGVQELHLFVLPVTMPASQPGRAGGLVVRVFASSRARAKGLPIRAGTLEIMAFEGALSDTASPGIKPAQTWVFPAARLADYAGTGSLGTGYELQLPWQGSRPTGGRLAVVARLVMPRGGMILTTAPSVISNTLR